MTLGPSGACVLEGLPFLSIEPPSPTMARELYSALDGWDLVYDEQDARGRDAFDASGTRLGTVTDMVADTDAERIVSLVLDNGTEVDADRVELQNDRVVVQGAAAATPHYGAGSHLRSRPLPGVAPVGAVAATPIPSGTDAGAYGGMGAPGTVHAAYDDHAGYFRSDFESNYGTLGGRYEDYEPAYRYGYDTARHDAYRDRVWDDQLESDLYRDYEGRYGTGTWEQTKAAVKSGFQRARNAVTGGDDGHRSTPY